MLEGKELEGKLGEFGGYSADVTPDGRLIIGAELRVDLIAELRKLAKMTTNTLDDAFVDQVESRLRTKPDTAA